MIKMYEGKDSNSQVFFRACELSNVKPTRRQYKKYCKKEGLAYKNKERASALLNPI